MKTIYLFLFIAVAGCSKEDDIPDYTTQNGLDPMFASSELISVTPYTYFQNAKQYFIRGDSSIYPNTVTIGGEEFTIPPEDRFSSKPEFHWDATGLKYVAAGIFNEVPSISSIDGTITNSEAMIWTWNTGMGTGREGNIEYEHGVAVHDGDFLNGTAPLPLAEIPERYYWAIWAWDENGETVLFSSIVFPFYVVEL